MENMDRDEQGRLELHEILCELLGSRNCYFQPTPSVQMNYPAIVYKLDGIKAEHADGRVYFYTRRYSVTLINEDPGNPTVAKLAELPYSEFDRSFVSDNLNHHVFTIYY